MTENTQESGVNLHPPQVLNNKQMTDYSILIRDYLENPKQKSSEVLKKGKYILSALTNQDKADLRVIEGLLQDRTVFEVLNDTCLLAFDYLVTSFRKKQPVVQDETFYPKLVDLVIGLNQRAVTQYDKENSFRELAKVGEFNPKGKERRKRLNEYEVILGRASTVLDLLLPQKDPDLKKRFKEAVTQCKSILGGIKKAIH